ncbi:MAG: hypothetical protein BWY25_02671 [Chloroflexi bacterium ADurb.Bin222]|nr:MAG: hypothetical protein BWY25_02671 [Chloroflexi bacterium ADurb.Bin222]
MAGDRVGPHVVVGRRRVLRIALHVDVRVERPAGLRVGDRPGDDVGGDGGQGHVEGGRRSAGHLNAAVGVRIVAISGGRHGIHPRFEAQHVDAVAAAGSRCGSPRLRGGFHSRALERTLGYGVPHDAAQGAGFGDRAAGETEGADARHPGGVARRRQVLLCVPEGAVVHWINAHHAVVAPAIVAAGLIAAADDQRRLGLGQRPQGIVRQPSGVAHGGIDAAAGHAVAQGEVALSVHRYTAHPAVMGIRGIRALLINRRRPAGVADLVPAHAGEIAARVHGVIDDQRFVIPKVAVGQPVHQPVADGVQFDRCARLRDTGARAGTQRRPRGGVQHSVWLSVEAKGRVVGIGPIHVELPEAHGVVRPDPRAVVHLHEVVGRALGR